MSDSNEMLIDEWDDPKSHENDIECRIENAVNQWNAHKYAKKKRCCDANNISEGQLDRLELLLNFLIAFLIDMCRALKRNANVPPGGRYIPRPPQGQRPAVPKRVLDCVRDLVTEKGERLEGVMPHEFHDLFVTEIAKENANNHLLAAPQALTYSKSTHYRMMDNMDVVEHIADVKNDARVKAFLNLKNHLSYCCLGNYFSQLVHPTQFHSCDDTSVLVNDTHSKPVCYTTKEAKEFLARRNIGISVHRNAEQQRVVVFNFTLSCDRVTCTVVKIKDDRFTDYITRPAVYYMEDNIYVMLYHVDCPEKTVNEAQFKGCILPEIFKKRRNSIKRDLFGLTELDWTKALVPTDDGSSDNQDRPEPGIGKGNNNCTSRQLLNYYIIHM